MEKVCYQRVVKIAGLEEEKIVGDLQRLVDVTSKLSVNIQVLVGEVHCYLTAEAEDKKTAKAIVKKAIKRIKARFNDHIFATKADVTLEDSVAKLLKKRHLTLTTAESCTGGLIAGRMVNVAGVSDVFYGSFVTYANEAKMELIGVKEETLQTYGAVSPETAREMVEGAAHRTHASAAIAVTGIAGPDGGTAEKPVGLVYIAVYVNGHGAVKRCQFKGDRMAVRQRTVCESLYLLRKLIKKESGNLGR